ncbi:MAG: RagB/SusD family nutrient uptake outer membrane protein [Bacteroidales bacterium]|nr:RagB/SusD family nutrient uptake outer membrane protein [Bacteroidales bacterium]
MKKSLIIAVIALAASFFTTGCIKETNPMTSTVTVAQAAAAPGAYQNFVDAITSSLCGQFTYGGSNNYPWDFGYPSFFLMRDVMGNDIVCETSGSEWYSTWYACGTGLGPDYAVCQLPWTYYYKWIKNCNVVLSMYKADPTEDKEAGAGIAYAMRAMFYMDMARMFCPTTYGADKEAITVPLVLDDTESSALMSNPRATNEVMWNQIIADLDEAEKLIAGYSRPDKYTPDLSVVYGLKARAYLTMENWSEARNYAKKAQSGYTLMTSAQYHDQKTGFNTPNDSWMFALTFKADDPNILNNDADSCWGSQMIIEVSESGCGYSANYVGPKRIDYHLFQTIPDTDWRKTCWVDFDIDDLGSKAAIVEALSAYSDSPEGLYATGYTHSTTKSYVGGMPVKFRPKDGEHADQYKAFTVAVPLMRVEEMYLIEAEAAGMMNEGEGKALLEAFAKTRDASYKYGDHTDTYYNSKTPMFQNEVWWQRRVELWGEGFATFDIKRLQKGIIRSYPDSNHPEDNRWNSETTPQWMTLCIVRTETNYNKACEQNPTPIKPTQDSDEYTW